MSESETEDPVETVEVEVEARGVGADGQVSLDNVFVAGQPVGRLLNALQDEVRDQEDRIDELEDQLEETTEIARAAIAVANRQANDGDDMTQQRRAELLSRNEVVQRANEPGRQGGRISIKDVQQMARPSHDLAYQTVQRAWRSLESDWRCIRIEDGDRRSLVVDAGDVPDSLLAAVSADVSDKEGR